MPDVLMSFDIFDRIHQAYRRLCEREQRTAAALTAAGIPYAVSGGRAVFVYMERHGEGCVRNTRDVDILLRREDFERAAATLAVDDIRLVWEARGLRDFTAVHAVAAGEMFRPGELEATPVLGESDVIEGVNYLPLPAVVRAKLVAFRLIDRVHLRDLADVELIDGTWPARYPPILSERLQHILDTPDG